MNETYPLPDRELAPLVPLIPASLEISTQKIDAGWWIWNICIKEECYGKHTISPWKSIDRSRRQYGIQLRCSEAFDPLPDLHWFTRALLVKGNDDGVQTWEVNEEGRITEFKVWTLSCKLLQLQIKAWSSKLDYQYDLVLDRDAFITLFLKTYSDFGKQGGWGWYGDSVFEEDWNMEPEEIILDCGKGIKRHLP